MMHTDTAYFWAIYIGHISNFNCPSVKVFVVCPGIVAEELLLGKLFRVYIRLNKLLYYQILQEINKVS